MNATYQETEQVDVGMAAEEVKGLETWTDQQSNKHGDEAGNPKRTGHLAWAIWRSGTNERLLPSGFPKYNVKKGD